MLQLILGKTGYGKTEYVQNLIKDLSKTKDIIFLVPDQVGFNMERDIINICPAHQAAKVKVFTFQRLAEDVFRTYGSISEKRIDDNGRNLLMSLAISDCTDSLEMYSSSAKAGRLTKLMLDVVKAFKSSQITPEDLFELVFTLEQKGLKNKIKEIALVYQSFMARLENVYIEPWDILTKTSEILNQNDYFKDKILIIDGFEVFDKEKFAIIKRAIGQCEMVYATLCCEDVYSDKTANIFTYIENTGKTLIALAKEENIKVLPFVQLEKGYRFTNPNLENLEKYFFTNLEAKEKSNGDGIYIYKAADIYKEVEYVAATIRNLVIDGYSYGDINVICSDDSPYISVVESVFEKYEIPAFIAKPRMIDTSPLVRLVLTAFKIAEFGFRTEDVLSLAKSGLCGLNSSEISVLENYVYMWKIEGKDWLKNFEKSPNGFSKKETGIKLETLESYRLKLVEPLVNFIKKTKNSTGVKLCEATYTLLVAYESEKYVWSNYKNLEKLLLLDEAQEQVRIWDEFIETLDQFAGILGEKTVEFKFFSKLLKDVLSKQEIMDVPLKLDSVMFLVSDKMKAQGKVSFLIGCVQDEFPKIPNTDTIFTQFERKYLSDFPFIKNIEEEILTQRFYAYTSALSCSEKLYVSYVSSQNPSEIISQIQSVCSVDVIEDLPYSYFANSYKSALSVAVKICRENSVESASLKKLIKENEVLDKKFTSIINSIDKKDLIIENANTAQNLFNLNYLSPSQIDTYHRCKFRFFCQYGIKAKEKSLAEIDVLEYGTIMHYVFENVLKEQEKYISLSEILLAEMVKNLIVDYCDKELGGYLNLDVRDKYRLTRVTKTAVVIVTRLMKELSQSKFSPKYLELKLEKDTDFPALEVIRENGEKINVGGIIDRVDIYENDKGKYVRIVDYKTGHKDFKLSDILQGISLQMLIYLSALQNTGLLPAGVLYMPSSFPEISASRDQKAEKLEEERSKKMCMSGMVLQDTQIVKAMEEKLEGKYIPIKLKKDGSYSSTENLIKNNELEKVFSFVRNIIATMANDLASGNVKAEPLMINTNACSYCPYACVCLIENNQDVIEQKLNKQTALDIIENKLLSEKEKE